MADALIAERVEQAYIRPIRTVLAVDDDFHRYDSAEGRNPRAIAIWRACRERGWLCDIDDGSDLISGKNTRYLFKSDLLILDYHLQGEDPKWSRDFLRQLADSDHASLVMVYTKDKDILSVRRNVAAHLKGVKERDLWFPDPKVEDEWDMVEGKVKEIPTGELIDAYIGGRTDICRSDKRLTDVLIKELKITGPAVGQMSDALYDTILIERLGVIPGNPCKMPPLLGGDDKVPWVYVNNLFVVCIVKNTENENDGELVFKDLEKALCEWEPDFMRASVAFARGEFARGGFEQERSSLSDPWLQAGWLYHAWAGGVEERDARLRVLFERIIRSYTGKVLDKVIEFGSKHIPSHASPAANLETLKAAIDQFCKQNPPQGEHVLHVLNEYLALDDLAAYVDTGTIFAPAASGVTNGIVYICVTPACDLVPRVPRGGSWEKQVHPYRPIVSMRCRIANVSPAHLTIAEQSKCIYLKVDGKQMVVVLSDDSAVPTLEWFFMEGMGKLGADKTFNAIAFTQTQSDAEVGQLKVEPMSMKALGQIRSIYANRILQAAGQHMSRIGVDFVNLPKPPDAKKEAKVAVKPVPRSDESAASQADQATVCAALLTTIPATKNESGAPAKTDLPPSPPEQV
ncbi:MAG: response regulator receiver domain [Planctomycetota bacterium]